MPRTRRLITAAALGLSILLAATPAVSAPKDKPAITLNFAATFSINQTHEVNSLTAALAETASPSTTRTASTLTVRAAWDELESRDLLASYSALPVTMTSSNVDSREHLTFTVNEHRYQGLLEDAISYDIDGTFPFKVYPLSGDDDMSGYGFVFDSNESDWTMVRTPSKAPAIVTIALGAIILLMLTSVVVARKRKS